MLFPHLGPLEKEKYFQSDCPPYIRTHPQACKTSALMFFIPRKKIGLSGYEPD